MFKLGDLTALVVGKIDDMGINVATILTRAGAQVIFVDADDAFGEEIATELGGDFICADIRQKADCRKIINFVNKKYGCLDILYLNVGMMPLQNGEYTGQLQQKSTSYIIQEAINAMKKNNYGRIIWGGYNSESEDNVMHENGDSLTFIKSIAKENAHVGITVNSVVMVESCLECHVPADNKSCIRCQYEMPCKKSLHLSVEDVGYAACFLASKEARLITGQTIVVNAKNI